MHTRIPLRATTPTTPTITKKEERKKTENTKEFWYVSGEESTRGTYILYDNTLFLLLLRFILFRALQFSPCSPYLTAELSCNSKRFSLPCLILSEFIYLAFRCFLIYETKLKGKDSSLSYTI